MAAFRVPRRRACGVVQCNRATFYYRSQRRDVTPLRMRLRELAAARPRFGYRRLHILLRREGWAINHKKTYRLHRDEQLGVRVHRRRIRILTVEDVFTRECLAVEVDTSLVSARVVAVLTRLVQARGAPAVISVDNGSEFFRARRTAGRTRLGCGWTSAGLASPWIIRLSRASMGGSETSISTPSCSSRWPTPRMRKRKLRRTWCCVAGRRTASSGEARNGCGYTTADEAGRRAGLCILIHGAVQQFCADEESQH